MTYMNRTYEHGFIALPSAVYDFCQASNPLQFTKDYGDYRSRPIQTLDLKTGKHNLRPCSQCNREKETTKISHNIACGAIEQIYLCSDCLKKFNKEIL